MPGANGHLNRSVVVYMYSPTLEQHIRDVQKVLAILRQEKLYVKASGCAFCREELGFLGNHIIGRWGVGGPS